MSSVYWLETYLAFAGVAVIDESLSIMRLFRKAENCNVHLG